MFIQSKNYYIFNFRMNIENEINNLRDQFDNLINFINR